MEDNINKKCIYCNKILSSKHAKFRHETESCKLNPNYKKTFNVKECKFCHKKFANKQYRYVHQKSVCKLNPENINYNNDDDTTNINNNNDNDNNTTNNNTTNINKIINNNKTINNNNIINNNNTINNNTINIIINQIGNEDISKLTIKEVNQIFDKELLGITTLIELLNFNDRLPENHNFCTTNLESKYSSIYNPQKRTVEKDRKKYLFDKILDNSIDKIQLLYNHYKNKFSSKKKEKYDKIIKDINEIKTTFFNDKIRKEIFNQINLISYNNNNIIKDTWNGNNKYIDNYISNNDIDNEENIINSDLELYDIDSDTSSVVSLNVIFTNNNND